MSVWGAGSAEDYETVAKLTGEPIISTMAPEELSAPAEAAIFRNTNSASAYQLWQVQKKKRDLRQEYLRHWEETATITGTGRPVDAIISPIAPHTAAPHGLNR